MTPAQTPPVAESVEVTQADREAAADLRGWSGAYEWHDHTPTVQAFARHRLAAYEDGRAEGMREAAEVADKHEATQCALFDHTEMVVHAHRASEANAIAEPLRALSKEPTK